MKCEICHQANAETALVRVKGDDETELYVCHACAERERKARQKKRERTRRADDSSSVSITVSGEIESPPPILGAILDAIKEMDLESESSSREESEETKVQKRPNYHTLPTSRVDKGFRIGDLLHLEGLHLIGELEATCRAMHALGMELVGLDCDGLNSPGHVYRLDYTGPTDRAKKVCQDLLREERNARIRLAEELRRIFSDAICRSLAMLKNCRLLAPAEYYDLLSPLRLAAIEGLLDGMTIEEIDEMIRQIDMSGSEDMLAPDERDRMDAERADEVNARFEEVVAHDVL